MRVSRDNANSSKMLPRPRLASRSPRPQQQQPPSWSADEPPSAASSRAHILTKRAGVIVEETLLRTTSRLLRYDGAATHDEANRGSWGSRGHHDENYNNGSSAKHGHYHHHHHHHAGRPRSSSAAGLLRSSATALPNSSSSTYMRQQQQQSSAVKDRRSSILALTSARGGGAGGAGPLYEPQPGPAALSAPPASGAYSNSNNNDNNNSSSSSGSISHIMRQDDGWTERARSRILSRNQQRRRESQAVAQLQPALPQYGFNSVDINGVTDDGMQSLHRRSQSRGLGAPPALQPDPGSSAGNSAAGNGGRSAYLGLDAATTSSRAARASIAAGALPAEAAAGLDLLTSTPAAASSDFDGSQGMRRIPSAAAAIDSLAAGGGGSGSAGVVRTTLRLHQQHQQQQQQQQQHQQNTHGGGPSALATDGSLSRTPSRPGGAVTNASSCDAVARSADTVGVSVSARRRPDPSHQFSTTAAVTMSASPRQPPAAADALQQASSFNQLKKPQPSHNLSGYQQPGNNLALGSRPSIVGAGPVYSAGSDNEPALALLNDAAGPVYSAGSDNAPALALLNDAAAGYRIRALPSGAAITATASLQRPQPTGISSREPVAQEAVDRGVAAQAVAAAPLPSGVTARAAFQRSTTLASDTPSGPYASASSSSSGAVGSAHSNNNSNSSYSAASSLGAAAAVYGRPPYHQQQQNQQSASGVSHRTGGAGPSQPVAAGASGHSYAAAVAGGQSGAVGAAANASYVSSIGAAASRGGSRAAPLQLTHGPPPSAAAPSAVVAAACPAFTGEEDVLDWPHRPVLSVSCATAVGGVSWRGRNPAGTKVNQDALIVAEHGPSSSLLVGVFDGHGTHGRMVSQYFKESYPAALFGDGRFKAHLAKVSSSATSPTAAPDSLSAALLGRSVIGESPLQSSATNGASAGPQSSRTSHGSDSNGGDANVSFRDYSLSQEGGDGRFRGHSRTSTGSSTRRSAGSSRVRSAGRRALNNSNGNGAHAAGTSPAVAPLPFSGNNCSGSGSNGSSSALAMELCCLMAEVLLELESALIRSGMIDLSLSGSTGVLCLVREGTLHTVNVGDSRCQVVSAPSTLVELSSSSLSSASAASTSSGDPAPGSQPGAMLMQQLQQQAAQNQQPEPLTSRGRRSAAHKHRPSPLLQSPTAGAGGGATITGAHHFSGPGYPLLTSAAVRAVGLTVDHKPDDPPEKQRIVSVGGRVQASKIPGAPQLAGPSRVWLRTAHLPGLNMSRSLGDLIAKQAGVISAPHMCVRKLQREDRALILGSDGLWDFVSHEEAGTVALSTSNTWDGSARLARLARARWLARTAGADDTTVIVVRLQPSTSSASSPAAASFASTSLPAAATVT